MNLRMIYISGKIAGLPEKDTRMKFLDAEVYLHNLGWDYVCNPMRIRALPTMQWEDYIIRDLLYLRQCTAIYMLKDWQDSPGAKVELAFAQGMGLQVFYQGETMQ